ncbi:Small glutamine-rich tetratricopeptide repeat-containing protein 2 [Sporothrix epigloea]|uniref:Small glutamine-rich tetratricopeptide repeat-containing protein 2 n=1 Tax=Sporothrix epigloea TaxID=1892477 RepID=A0ABP0DNY6_9PEZI
MVSYLADRPQGKTWLTSTSQSLTTKQRLALAICDFLSTSAEDGTIAADERDSVDVAITCVAESFKVDPTDKAAIAAALGGQSLEKIFGVYEKLRGGSASSVPSGATAAASVAATSGSNSASTATDVLPTAAAIKEAELLKSKGNAAMAQKNYSSAVSYYTQALALHPRNAIYLSNRAAAHSAAKDHATARIDAEAAVAIDPTYTKAWSRLGLAKFALGDAQGAMEAYQDGIRYEGNGGSEAMKKGYETAKRRVDELAAEGDALARTASPTSPMGGGGGGIPDLASMLGGGGGGGGGFPDFASIMNNPMFASMAQNLMSNPELMSNLMNNPRLREMTSQFGNGGGMPDLSSLMSDPSIAEMARNIMGGAGAGGGGAGRNNNNADQ